MLCFVVLVLLLCRALKVLCHWWVIKHNSMHALGLALCQPWVGKRMRVQVRPAVVSVGRSCQWIAFVSVLTPWVQLHA